MKQMKVKHILLIIAAIISALIWIFNIHPQIEFYNTIQTGQKYIYYPGIDGIFMLMSIILIFVILMMIGIYLFKKEGQRAFSITATKRPPILAYTVLFLILITVFGYITIKDKIVMSYINYISEESYDICDRFSNNNRTIHTSYVLIKKDIGCEDWRTHQVPNIFKAQDLVKELNEGRD